LVGRLSIACSLAAMFDAPQLAAQAWRQATATIAPSARVLIIGTRPEDEDNALIAWAQSWA